MSSIYLVCQLHRVAEVEEFARLHTFDSGKVVALGEHAHCRKSDGRDACILDTQLKAGNSMSPRDLSGRWRAQIYIHGVRESRFLLLKLYSVVVDGPVTDRRQDIPASTRASSHRNVNFTFEQSSSSPAQNASSRDLVRHYLFASLRKCTYPSLISLSSADSPRSDEVGTPSQTNAFNPGVCNVLMISRATARLLLW